MRGRLVVLLASLLIAMQAAAGEAEVGAAQSSIEGQLKAFLADDHAGAYAYAAPNVRRIFPTVDSFMSMVTSGYQPVHRPQHYSFGKVEERSASQIWQQVFLTGPDGKDYEALYTLELQPDGVWRITGVSLRAATALST